MHNAFQIVKYQEGRVWSSWWTYLITVVYSGRRILCYEQRVCCYVDHMAKIQRVVKNQSTALDLFFMGM